MIKTCIVVLFALLAQQALSQNVGVGTNTPSEKLHVNGNINLDGNLKVNGVEGQNGQVLTTNAEGKTQWADLSGYKNNVIFTQSGIWVVPAGVTKITIQGWGGGGGGAVGGGGGSGVYLLMSNFTVAPGNQLTITIGAGGAPPTAENLPASPGAQSVIFFNSPGLTYSTPGGSAATPNRPGLGTSIGVTAGQNVIYVAGNSGENTKETYHQYDATNFVTCRQYGNGADPTMVNGLKGGKGAFWSFYHTAAATLLYTRSTSGGMYGCGGGGGNSGSNPWGSPGGSGTVIIHY